MTTTSSSLVVPLATDGHYDLFVYQLHVRLHVRLDFGYISVTFSVPFLSILYDLISLSFCEESRNVLGEHLQSLSSTYYDNELFHDGSPSLATDHGHSNLFACIL
jgi:hypothetical protein